MSADNGVYVLVTKGKKAWEKEYRISHCQAIENIFEEGEVGRDYQKHLFGKSPVFYYRTRALIEADKIAQAITLNPDGGILEYGMKFIELDTTFPT